MSDNRAALWLTEQQTTIADDALARADGTHLVAIADQLTAVPGEPQGFMSTLFGELLSFLARRGLALPRCRVGHVLLSLVKRPDAPKLLEQLENIVRDVKDSDFVLEQGFVLYMDEPAVVRKGIEYLRQALAIPEEYEGLIIVGS